MANAPRDSRSRTDRDGVRVTTTREKSATVPALVVLAVVGWLVARTFWSEPRQHPTPALPGEDVSRTAVAPLPATAAAPDPQRVEDVRQRRAERELERRERSEPRFTANAPGEQAGMAAFPPPGTKPIKRGLVVPDDFELPPGYVRHYQTTDDGRPLLPILMFHPDFAGVDENGNPIAVPEDRIVPPELAPPGLPLHTLDETTDFDETVGRRARADAQPSSP
jgi:hypothetical protein